MKNRPVIALAVLLSVLLLPLAALAAPPAAEVTVFATGLNNPRGLKFGPDGKLYVAEGGTGGTQTTTEEQCPQVIPPVGPYSGDFTARISKIDRQGNRTTVAAGLPSSQTGPALGGLVSGVSDVAFVGHKLYALLAGAGCSHGLAHTNNGIIRVFENGSWELVANLSHFVKTHPVAHPEEDDFEPDGTWWNMVFSDGAFYVTEPNHGELDRVKLNGKISRVVDVSASQGHIVPTALTEVFPGFFLLSNLNTFPTEVGSSSLFVASRNGFFAKLLPGFTAVLGLAVRHGKVYVLEMTTQEGGPSPFNGDIVSVDIFGHRETVAEGLAFPTGMTFGPDGNLYVSNFGFGFPEGAGQILKIKLP